MGYQPSGADERLRQPVTSKRDLVEYFRACCKKPGDMMIGMEVELHGIHTDTYKPITYLEKKGMKAIQIRLNEEFGWEPEKKEGKYIISMERRGTHFSLESSEGMAEFASRVHVNIHGLASEWRAVLGELTEISKASKVAWLGIGYQPFVKAEDVRDVQIKRFLSNTELPVKKKSQSDDYSWRNIASVQTNVDFKSEEDAVRKFQTLLRLAPFVNAMYSHAPLREGKDSKFVSYRTHIFRDIYPWRSGVRKEFFSADFNLNDWTEFCMKVPMVSIFRNGEWIKVKEMNFKQFLKNGYEGYTATLEDWIIQLSFIYTDARIRNFIELRVCDSVPPALVPSVHALTKAFVYHKDGAAALKDLTRRWKFEDFDNAYERIAERGMGAVVKGVPMLEYCKHVLEVGSSLLKSLKIADADGHDESVYLKPIRHFVFVEEKSPGTWVRDQWNGPWKQNPEKLIAWCKESKFRHEDL